MFENTNNEYVKSWWKEGRDIIYLHGSESGPIGGKYTKLLEAFPGRVYAPDFRGLDKIEDRLTKLYDVLQEGDYPVYLVGSSFGGLLAALFADKYPGWVKGYLLMVPAFCEPYKEMSLAIKNIPYNSYILASLNDEYIPAQDIIDFAHKFKMGSSFVPDSHRLLNSLDKMIEYTKP